MLSPPAEIGHAEAVARDNRGPNTLDCRNIYCVDIPTVARQVEPGWTLL